MENSNSLTMEGVYVFPGGEEAWIDDMRKMNSFTPRAVDKVDPACLQIHFG